MRRIQSQLIIKKSTPRLDIGHHQFSTHISILTAFNLKPDNLMTIFVDRPKIKKRPDLNFFKFPGEKRLSENWRAFCCHGDKEFTSIKNLHVCSEHFETKQINWTGHFLGWKG